MCIIKSHKQKSSYEMKKARDAKQHVYNMKLLTQSRADIIQRDTNNNEINYQKTYNNNGDIVIYSNNSGTTAM